MRKAKPKRFRVVGFDAMCRVVTAVESSAPRPGWYWKKRHMKKYVQRHDYVDHIVVEYHY